MGLEKKTRAAFLPTPGDPFLLQLWLSFFPRWMDEVDRLYIYVNSGGPSSITNYIKKSTRHFGDKIFFIHLPKQIEHGEALRQMVELASEDLIMFVEDDAFIFKSGAVDHCFRQIESDTVDAVGSRRGSCSQWLYDTASAKWSLDNSGEGDHGPNFWPNFFFAKRDDLLKVSNFAARHWNEGDMVDPLSQRAPEVQVGDTFVEGSLQLRANGLRFGYRPQFHGNTDDEPDYYAHRGIWSPECSWLHVGSLSSGFHGMLKSDHQIDHDHFSTDQEKLELERRIVFYKWSLEEANKHPGLETIKAGYYKAIQRLIDGYQLNESRINRRLQMYKEVML